MDLVGEGMELTEAFELVERFAIALLTLEDSGEKEPGLEILGRSLESLTHERFGFGVSLPIASQYIRGVVQEHRVFGFAAIHREGFVVALGGFELLAENEPRARVPGFELEVARECREHLFFRPQLLVHRGNEDQGLRKIGGLLEGPTRLLGPAATVQELAIGESIVRLFRIERRRSPERRERFLHASSRRVQRAERVMDRGVIRLRARGLLECLERFQAPAVLDESACCFDGTLCE